ncbi:hypothetical protein [Scytonema sp. PCC 10023]|uniref:hypothetical protein n=1 Tax=Scytonema sp. PCC 10023 TaxID=1680591 RepID=UPI0039C60DE7
MEQNNLTIQDNDWSAKNLQGAIHLFAALSVAEGLIYGCCRPTKTFLDFQGFLLEVLIPQAIRRSVRHIYLILDNGSSHAPKQLQTWLNQKQQEEGWAFTVEVIWLPKKGRGQRAEGRRKEGKL